MLINCESIRNKHKENLKHFIQSNNIHDCKVVFIQVGNNPASTTYVNNKTKLCSELGIIVQDIKLSEHITELDLLSIIDKLNINNSTHGIMVQLPLPTHINEETIINAINPKKDIDGFSLINKGQLTVNNNGIIPCTPKGILNILDEYIKDYKGKNVTIVGKSNIVGKPIASALINLGATVTVCNSSTDKHKLKDLISNSDIFISAIGQPNYFDKEFFKDVDLSNTIAIDVGINRDINNKLCGDIDRELIDTFKYQSPVPKGVGIMTVQSVAENTIRCYMLQKQNK